MALPIWDSLREENGMTNWAAKIVLEETSNIDESEQRVTTNDSPIFMKYSEKCNFEDSNPDCYNTELQRQNMSLA